MPDTNDGAALVCLWGVCGYECACHSHVERSEDSGVELFLSFHHMGSRDLNSGHQAWQQVL